MLRVALLANFQRRRNVHKVEPAHCAGAVAHFGTRGRVRRDLRANRNSAVPRDLGRDVADAHYIQIAVRARKTQLAREEPPHLVAVKQRHVAPSALEERGERLRERRLARTGKAGQEDHQSA
jgi:hypothetical protein